MGPLESGKVVETVGHYDNSSADNRGGRSRIVPSQNGANTLRLSPIRAIGIQYKRGIDVGPISPDVAEEGGRIVSK